MLAQKRRAPKPRVAPVERKLARQVAQLTARVASMLPTRRAAARPRRQRVQPTQIQRERLPEYSIAEKFRSERPGHVHVDSLAGTMVREAFTILPEYFVKPPPPLASASNVTTPRAVTVRCRAWDTIALAAANDYALIGPTLKSQHPIAFATGNGTYNFPASGLKNRDYINGTTLGNTVQWGDVGPWDINAGVDSVSDEHFHLLAGYVELDISVAYNGQADVYVVEPDLANGLMEKFSHERDDVNFEGAGDGTNQDYSFYNTAALSLTDVKRYASQVHHLSGGSTSARICLRIPANNNSPSDWFHMPQGIALLDAGIISTSNGGYPVGNLRNVLATANALVLVVNLTATQSNVILQAAGWMCASADASSVFGRAGMSAHAARTTSLRPLYAGGRVGCGPTAQAAKQDLVAKTVQVLQQKHENSTAGLLLRVSRESTTTMMEAGTKIIPSAHDSDLLNVDAMFPAQYAQGTGVRKNRPQPPSAVVPYAPTSAAQPVTSMQTTYTDPRMQEISEGIQLSNQALQSEAAKDIYAAGKSAFEFLKSHL